MRNPHVVKLTYQLKPDKNISFPGAPPIEEDRDSFHIRLDEEYLTIEMKEHFSSPDDARKLVEPFLRSWEIDAALFYNHPAIQFIYKDAEVIDLDPHPPGVTTDLEVNTSDLVIVSENVTLHVNYPNYPFPPITFSVTPEVEILWHRYWGYRQNQEPLLAMAYYCLTYIEKTFGKRQRAARQLGISDNVLDKLGNFASHRGNFQTARKVSKDSNVSPLNSREVDWIDTLIKMIIRRMGERSPTSTFPQITMDDLPPLY